MKERNENEALGLMPTVMGGSCVLLCTVILDANHCVIDINKNKYDPQIPVFPLGFHVS
jgi:hypothetical protein